MGLGVKLTGAPDEAAARRDRLPFPLRTIHVCIFFLSFSFKFTTPQIAQSSTAVAILTLSILSQMARLDSATDPRFWTLFDDAGGKKCPNPLCDRRLSTLEAYKDHLRRCGRKHKRKMGGQMQSASSSNDKGVVIPAGTALVIEQQSFYNDAVAREAVSKYVQSELPSVS